jgi:uncharacterized membrane protein (DUF485 family)
MTFHSAVQEGSAFDGTRDSRDTPLHSPHFADLLRTKRATVIPLLVVSIGFFICIALMAGFARPLMMMKVTGSLNLGFLLILVGYGVCWIAALLYIVAANRLFDEKVAIVIRTRLGEEKRP